MTRKDIAVVIKVIPDLTPDGVGLVFSPPRGNARKAEIARQQEELLGMTKECTAVCDWLALKEPTKTVGTLESYGLKHRFERETGMYVTNGAFIAAAVHSGFPYKIDPPNVRFGISKKSLKEDFRDHRKLRELAEKGDPADPIFGRHVKGQNH